ncbi:MAG: hypothetical protein K2P39_03960 [Lachnospiraceae bacterium]|nr:hypothetical protein [Lachnospiraceae bacterium]
MNERFRELPPERQKAILLADSKMSEILDFFELMTYAAIKKIRVLVENPYIVDFAVRSFYTDKEEISDDLKNMKVKGISQNYEQFLSKTDCSKFKDGVNPHNIWNMIVWMTDGYVHERQMRNRPLCFDEIEKEFKNWIQMFKQFSYKEEYL